MASFSCIICISMRKADFGSYVDRAVQKILTDSNADPETEFAEAQKLCEKEALEKFNEANQK